MTVAERLTAELKSSVFFGKQLNNRKRKFGSIVLLVIILGSAFWRPANATQDVEDPTQIFNLIRLVLSEPLVIAEVHRLVDEGCTWEDQVFWSGSPSEEALRTRVFWMTLSMKIATQSGKTYWKQFQFSRKAQPILEIFESTDSSKVVDCSD